jgi:type I restriction-modification system DNA methylase subunit
MLDKDTKKKIDDARDTLVGVLPLPTDQIELITIALIYKFMDDQDEELRQVGLQEKFFTGELKEFSWQQLMSNQLSADQRVTKFINGIEAIQKAKQVPNLFREIFLNAFLKFRDGKVLQRFLDIINGFTYDHSEELGNSFEYLLMTMGAQGDNGQFRTPRNIIDFIVEVVDPQKDETILDPACGTGGFLVSAFKHILKRNTAGYETAKVELENYVSEGIPVYWGAKLSSSERNAIEKNIVGYDNTPLMVRLARVNMYLHHFGNPQIHEYNTLNTDTRWKDKFDCILANPPFMTPKGGIDPHDKFRIPANRTEILFSSYILQHLNPDGKAGFVVPEGIIFQTTGDYITLRNWLIYEAGLWAVVSLPSNIFQPYSGVKTSILFIDREIARKRNDILLLKIDNDGFSLNTNRHPIKANDLPEALEWLEMCKKDLDKFQNEIEQKADKPFLSKLRLLHRDEFAKLDHYKATSTVYTFCKRHFEKTVKSIEEINDSLISERDLFEKEKNKIKLQKITESIRTYEEKKAKLLLEYTKRIGASVLFDSEQDLKNWFEENIKEAAIEYGTNLNNTNKLTKEILELLDSSRDFVLSYDKFAGEENVLNDDVDYRKLEEVCKVFVDGDWIEKIDQSENGIRLIQTGNIGKGKFREKDSSKARFISEDTFQRLNCTEVLADDILVSRLPDPVGRACIIPPFKEKLITAVDCTIIRLDENIILPKFFIALTHSDFYYKKVYEKVTGASRDRISRKNLGSIEIPIPSIPFQESLIEKTNQYFNLIEGCNLIVDNYIPVFEINPDWERVKLGNIFKLSSGQALTQKNMIDGQHFVYGGNGISGKHNDYFLENPTLVIGRVGEYCGAAHITNPKSWVTDNGLYVTEYLREINQEFLLYAIQQINLNQYAKIGGQPSISQSTISEIEIQLPEMEIQNTIASEIRNQRSAVESVIELKRDYEAKIKSIIDKVWGR